MCQKNWLLTIGNNLNELHFIFVCFHHCFKYCKNIQKTERNIYAFVHFDVEGGNDSGACLKEDTNNLISNSLLAIWSALHSNLSHLVGHHVEEVVVDAFAGDHLNSRHDYLCDRLYQNLIDKFQLVMLENAMISVRSRRFPRFLLWSWVSSRSQGTEGPPLCPLSSFKP